MGRLFLPLALATTGSESYPTTASCKRIQRELSRLRPPLPGLFLQRGRIPELDRAIMAARGQEAAIETERGSPNQLGVTAQRYDLPAGGRVPQLHCVVAAGRDQAAAIGAERNPVQTATVS